MLSPVFEELEKRYPKFLLLDVPSGKEPPPEAHMAAKNAVAALETDEQLKKLITDSFNNLEQGQYEIKNQINKITLRLDAINESVGQLSDTSDKNFDTIIIQLSDIQRQLDSLGTSVGFQNKAVIFPLGFELPEDSVESHVKLFISGNTIELSVDKARPYTTVDVPVPKAGIFPYSTECQEVTTVYLNAGADFIPKLISCQYSNKGQIKILPNAIYQLVRSINLRPQNRGGNYTTINLEKVLTSEKQAEEDKKYSDPDELLRIMNELLED